MQTGFASFRDPDGRVFIIEGRILRATTREGADVLRAAMDLPAVQRLLADGRIAGTRSLPAEEADAFLARVRVDGPAAWTEVFEHDAIPFPSYPYEWPPEMLHAAGELTIEIAQHLLTSGYGIKDATPYNVLFRGPHPVFIDLLSFERRNPHDPVWLAYAQFVRTFALPLALNRQSGIPLSQIFLIRRDGLEPEEVYRWLPTLGRFRSPFLSMVSVPVLLAHRQANQQNGRNARVYQPHLMSNAERARFVFEHRLASARKTLRKLEPRRGKSDWSEYEDTNTYSSQAAAAKAAFVDGVLQRLGPRRVLDVGANTGRHSELAASRGAAVVAVDSDPVVVGALWRRARARDLDILPLVVNIARPAGGVGWRNRECASFLDRCTGVFDLVLMLALAHHLLVTERIPLSELVDLAAELTTDAVIIEFVGRRDPMFERLLRGRDALYEHITASSFEECVRRRFTVVHREPIEGMERTLYLLRKLS